MKIAVRYFTRTGNTEKLAKAIADAVGVSADKVSVPLDEKVDILFLGSSVYGGDVDNAIKKFLEENSSRIERIVNFSTAALLRSTYKQIKKLTDKSGIILEVEDFYCRGSFSVMHRGRPNDTDLQKAADFAKSIVNKLDR